MTVHVTLPSLASPVDQVWHVLLELAERIPTGWTLAGGQMVLLHGLEKRQVPPRVSQDGDVIADLRADPLALRDLVSTLTEIGFEVDGMSPTGLAHRYRRMADPRPVLVDVLAPEGLGPRTDLTTTPPGRTLEVPGGTQALQRTERIEVRHEGRTAFVPRPSLLGAIIAKSAACALPGDSSRHHRDVAFLCSLVEDPMTMRDELTKKDRKRLRFSGALGSSIHPAWLVLPDDLRQAGYDTYRLLRVDD